MLIRGIPRVSYIVFLTWVLVIYNIANRWELINSENYVFVEFFIYLFTVTSIIWGVIWGIRYKTIKTCRFLILCILILSTAVSTYLHFADTAKLYIDFTINYRERKEIAERLVDRYVESLKTQDYPDSLIYLGEEYKRLSTQGYAKIWRDRGCIEVDFEVFSGKSHNFIDLFNYGKSGHITYVTDVSKYNLKGGTIQNHIIATKKIFGNWYFNLTKY